MKKAICESSIDNDLYNADGDIWWQTDSPFYLLQCSVNPARLGYFKRIMMDHHIEPQGKSLLDIGCGGGSVYEEMARMGFHAAGIDPSEQSLKIASDHAMANGLQINYKKGTGEALPYPDSSMDIVLCCDVLEHVRDAPKVISEIARVLKPGGCFFYDTFNRTFLSKLMAIKISQEWKRWAYAPPDLHDWNLFLRPEELRSLLEENDMKWMENRGLRPNVSFPVFLRVLRKRAMGHLTYKELGEKLYLVEDRNMSIMYMGYAVKK